MPRTPTPSQGRRRNGYRPSSLIRNFFKAASTDTAQITSTENQLSVFLSFATHSSLLFLVWRSANRPNWRQKNNGTISLCIDVYNYVPQKTASQWFSRSNFTLNGGSWYVWCIFTCSELYSLIKPFLFAPSSQPQPNKSMCMMMSLLGNE